MKDEIRVNLIARHQKGKPIFPGVIGYDDPVIPQIVNAPLSRHNFILSGLRGQAKSRIMRQVTVVLDSALPASRAPGFMTTPMRPCHVRDG